jgi:hypothetical protein
MTNRRAPVFTEDLDVSEFTPAAATKGVGREDVKAIAGSASFRSREPEMAPAPVRREVRRYRTGRNVQLNLKVRQEDADIFYALADEHGWVLGEAFQKAVEALRQSSKGHPLATK